jgi:hypothetical protein
VIHERLRHAVGIHLVGLRLAAGWPRV